MMQLRLARDAGLRREEVIAVILYTGPLVRAPDFVGGWVGWIERSIDGWGMDRLVDGSIHA